jgi:hypothetical protein
MAPPCLTRIGRSTSSNPTYAKISEAADIVAAVLARTKGGVTLVRAHHLLTSALSDFFTDANDTAGLAEDEFEMDVDTPF